MNQRIPPPIPPRRSQSGETTIVSSNSLPSTDAPINRHKRSNTTNTTPNVLFRQSQSSLRRVQSPTLLNELNKFQKQQNQSVNHQKQTRQLPPIPIKSNSPNQMNQKEINETKKQTVKKTHKHSKSAITPIKAMNEYSQYNQQKQQSQYTQFRQSVVQKQPQTEISSDLELILKRRQTLIKSNSPKQEIENQSKQHQLPQKELPTPHKQSKISLNKKWKSFTEKESEIDSISSQQSIEKESGNENGMISQQDYFTINTKVKPSLISKDMINVEDTIEIRHFLYQSEIELNKIRNEMKEFNYIEAEISSGALPQPMPINVSILPYISVFKSPTYTAFSYLYKMFLFSLSISTNQTLLHLSGPYIYSSMHATIVAILLLQ